MLAVGLFAAAVLPVGVAAQSAPEVAAACAQSTAPGVMQAWERSGGNKQMVDLADPSGALQLAGTLKNPVAGF